MQALTHPRFPLDPWRLVETQLGGEGAFHHETLFALANGHIGLRGTHEDGLANRLEGSYVNGFYDTEPIRYPESAYGLAHTNEFMLHVANAKCIGLRVDGESPTAERISAYERVLDLRSGLLTRRFVWTLSSGKQLEVQSTRVVSLQQRHVFAIEYTVTPLNFGGALELTSSIDTEVDILPAGDDPRVGSHGAGESLHTLQRTHSGNCYLVLQKTRNSGLSLATAIHTVVDGAAAQTIESGHSFTVKAKQDETVRLTKFGAYVSSRDVAADSLTSEAHRVLDGALQTGFAGLCAQQAAYLADFWEQADVDIGGDAALQQGVRVNQFHLLQSVGRDGKTNIAAKGLTGEGYEGHYFWDTEIYVLPFFLFNRPEIARALLMYRYSCLPKARERARAMAHARGALFPWRTIAGEECSSYFPAGTAQYHINADIAYATKLYVEATGDLDFMAEAGLEMVLDTARIWMDLGHVNADGQFAIHAVTGPDEYTAIVDNNFYTNAMARQHLRFAAAMAERLQSERPQDFARVAQAIGLAVGETEAWLKAAEAMKLPYDARLGIHAQDDSFLAKKRWDFVGTPDDKYPLLLHFHPLVIYRHQVCKQADVMLAMMLLSDQFSLDDKRRDFDYYEAVTTHDSSLSSCIFGIMAAEVGQAAKAYDYFMETARLDLDNTHGNTEYGIHAAAMAGTWLGVAYGFGGMRLCDGSLRFAPTLPKAWTHYQFQVHFRGALLRVRVSPEASEYTLVRGESITFSERGVPIQLDQATPSVRILHPEAA